MAQGKPEVHSKTKPAALLDITGPTLVLMKWGKAAGKLAYPGDRCGQRIMLATFPDDQKTKSPASLSTGGASVWRKRRKANI